MAYRLEKIGLEEAHQGTLGILKKIDSICSELGLTYWVAYGTMLGAIRHHGFIPWDDDLDICMMRKDYDIFLEYFKEHKEELYPFKLNHQSTEKKYPFYLARISDERYVLDFDRFSYQYGLFVDVYPYDYAGTVEDQPYWQQVYTKHTALYSAGSMAACLKSAAMAPKEFYGNYRRVLNWSRGGLLKKFPMGYGLFSAIVIPIASVCRILGRDFFMNRMMKASRGFTDEGSTHIGIPVINSRTFPREEFEHFIKMPFEDMEVNVPAAYDTIMTRQYGDYMTPPAEKDRTPHHNYTAYRKVYD